MGKVYGVAVNDVRGSTRCCHIYKIWISMLSRCYSEKVKARQPKYTGCYVCDDWLIFSKFKSWVLLQDWDGKQLDKDILIPGNKVYDPVACRFVSRRVNSILTFRKSKKSKHMLGVFANDSKAGNFKASIRIEGKIKCLGTYETQIEAHRAYVLAKIDSINTLADSILDLDVAGGLRVHSEILRETLESKGFIE